MNKESYFTYNNSLLFDMALQNCHVKGLHGIVFAKQGEGKNQILQRMFIAGQDHNLYQNACQGDQVQFWDPLSLAVHPHRVDIEIQVITGTIWNMQFEKIDKTENQALGAHLLPYKWNSHIMKTQKSGGFEQTPEHGSAKIKYRRQLSKGDKIKMRSDQLHTVYIQKGKSASWFITESKPTGEYDGITYANHNLAEWTSEGLYIKPSREQVIQYLKIAGIELK